MTPLNLHYVHFGGELPAQHVKWMRGIVIKTPWRKIYEWNEHNIKELGLDYAQLSRDFPGYAGVSNVVRLAAVLKYGGVYLDTDFEGVRSLTMLLQIGSAIAAKQRDGRICNAFFGATPGHPWVKWQLDRVNESKGLAAYWGVDLMSAAPRDGLTIIPTHLVYPFMWDDEKEKRVAHPDSLLVHHWAGSWVKK